MKSNHVDYISIDDRDQSTIRAVILARSSDPGAKPEDMRGQVEQCLKFIAAMGWTLAFPAYTYTESKTGMRDVERPMLDAVLKLAIQGEVDVIVCREFERVARSKGRRWQAIQTALDYGVEFRFANLEATRGKLDDSGTMRLIQEVREFMAEAEAEKITERLMPEKMRRFADGLPHGGGTGPNYGYVAGERRQGKHGKPMGVTTWVIEEAEAKWVRWLFQRVDEQPPAEVSYRGLAKELARRGVTTPSGTATWSATQVRYILTNPKYCGLGRNLRYWSEWDKKRDPETNQVRPKLFKHDRQREAERLAEQAAQRGPEHADEARANYLATTYEVKPTAIPPIVTPEQWERVQKKLKEAMKLQNRGGPRRIDAEANSTLLDHGYIRCAECGSKMTRHWETKSSHPYYRCSLNADRPGLPHIGFHVPARGVDALAIQLLAKALTDPKKILELAGAAEAQLAEANMDAELAASALAAYHQRLIEIDAQCDELMTAQDALRRVSGMEGQVKEIQARLAQLNRDREEAETNHDNAIPQRDHAQARADFLRQVFTVRGGILDLDTGAIRLGEPTLSIGQPGIRPGANGEPEHYTTLTLPQAAKLLGVSIDELETLGLPIRRGEPFTYKLAEGGYGTDQWQDTVETVDVVELVLAKMPRERVRRLFYDLDAVVKVTRGRTRAEITAGVKKPPLTDRVYLELLGTVQVRTDVKKLNTSS